MDLYMEVVSSLWIFMFKDLSNDIFKMKFESSLFFHLNIKKNPQSKFIKDRVDNSTHNVNMSLKPLMFF